jgi:4-carboxymuconolactone decarboxylase
VRIKGIHSIADYPLGPDGQPAPEIVELFAFLFPGVENPKIDENHAGTAITAHNPKLAMLFAQLSRFMALDVEWSKRADLRELAFATLNLKLKSAYSFESRLAAAKASGISAEQLAMLPLWENSALFDDEQKLVIEYTNAVVSGEVPEALFARVVARFGEKGAVEFTAVVGFWSCWAMLLNAIRP